MRDNRTASPLDPRDEPNRDIGRRAVLKWAGVLGAGVALGGGATLWSRTRATTNLSLPLYSETVAFRAEGQRELVPAGAADTVVPGSRVLVDATDRERLVAAETEWLDAADPWTRVDDEWAPMLRDALLDVRALLYAGTSVAAWSPSWRYVWPRDTAHVAAALAAVGHRDYAEAALEWLEEVQRPREWFEARYDPSSRATPDDRPRQLDGHGWTLWALDRLDTANRATGDLETVTRRLLLLERCLETIEAEIDPVTGLPPVSPDYWERKESRLTLGTAAPLLVGLRSAKRLALKSGRSELEARADKLASSLEAGIVEAFAPRRFQRYAHGGGHCTSVAFLLPPYLEAAVPGAEEAFDEARATMARPAGGVAPGAGWKQDGISWTPETAIFANGARATGRQEVANEYFTWLEQHRTAVGSLPEKVRADGLPAAVAPLAWTAAVVIDGISHLRDRDS